MQKKLYFYALSSGHSLHSISVSNLHKKQLTLLRHLTFKHFWLVQSTSYVITSWWTHLVWTWQPTQTTSNLAHVCCAFQITTFSEYLLLIHLGKAIQRYKTHWELSPLVWWEILSQIWWSRGCQREWPDWKLSYWSKRDDYEDCLVKHILVEENHLRPLHKKWVFAKSCNHI